jgi:tRNA-uridine 2-sulfurtransferase
VDSAVAAMLLREQGRRVSAATLRMWPSDDVRSCCSDDALRRARDCAHRLGLPFEELDDEEPFRRLVVEPFVQAYLDGETPNPCADCNRFRLADLVERAAMLGAPRVATGHYARVVWRGGEPFVARARHARKDQSYMLWRVAPQTIAHLEFPLGELTKEEVRHLAEAGGLPVAHQPESQDVCFATAGYRQFLRKRGVASQPGAVVDSTGRVLGRHDGQWEFTVGQRRGLRLAAPEPLYVLERRGAANEVVVGGHEELMAAAFVVRELADRGLGEGAGLLVQSRYRSSATAVAGIRRLGGGRAEVRLAEPIEAPAPGQSAVFYDHDVVVGGGVVDGRSARRAGAGRASEAGNRLRPV